MIGELSDGTADGDDAGAGGVRRPGWVRGLHGAGVVISLVALAMRGLDSPAVGFPIAIAILAGLGVPASPKPRNPEKLRTVHGSVLGGGIRQGAFIKGMFAASLLYMGLIEWAGAGATGGVTDVLLGSALAISSAASEIEALQVRRLL